MKSIRLGLISFGYIGKIHSIAYRSIPLALSQPQGKVEMAALLRSRLDTEQEAMDEAGFALCTTSMDEFFAQPLDLVDICSPNNLHLEHASRALKSGAAVYCEKPLARNLDEACQLVDLAEKAGALTQVAFTMRWIPAMRQMKAFIEAGEVGEVFHFRGQLFHGSYIDPNRPMSWRLRRAQSGGGAFMDLGAHLVDMAMYLLGDVLIVRAKMRTFISERSTAKGSQQKEAVDVDDWALCTLEMKSGATGSLEVTRMAAGASEASGFEVYGSKGALIYREHDPLRVDYFSVRRGEWIRGPGDVPPVDGERPIEQVWPSSKYSLGGFVNAHLAAQVDFLLNIQENKPSQVDFRTAAKVQEVLEAAFLSAERGGELYRLE